MLMLGESNLIYDVIINILFLLIFFCSLLNIQCVQTRFLAKFQSSHFSQSRCLVSSWVVSYLLAVFLFSFFSSWIAFGEYHFFSPSLYIDLIIHMVSLNIPKQIIKGINQFWKFLIILQILWNFRSLYIYFCA